MPTVERALRVHLWIWPRDDDIRDASYRRVIFQRLPVEDLDLSVGDHTAGFRELESKLFRDYRGRVYHPVLVDVRQLAENGETVFKRILSLARLEESENFEMAVTHIGTNASFFEPVLGVLDRELDPSGLFVGGFPLEVVERELPDDVVKGRPHVVEAVTDPHAPIEDGEVDIDRVQRDLRSLRVVVAPDRTRLVCDGQTKMRLKRIEVLKRMVDLGAGAGVVERHSLTSSHAA
jgi:hypothetical protein